MPLRRSLALPALLVATLVPCAPAAAQSDCQQIGAVMQARLLDPDVLLRSGDTWGGTAYLRFDTGELLKGRFSGNDGTIDRPNTVLGRGRGGTYFFDFGDGNTFTLGSTNAIFPIPPGRTGVGQFGTSASLSEGTGRFAGATGNIRIEGPYVVWFETGIPWPPSGRWNGTLNGALCGFLPAVP